MNKTAIKKYAVAARRKLIEAVAQKMRYYGFEEDHALTGAQIEEKLANNGVHLDKEQIAARAKLYERVKAHGFQTVVEEVAYTWFNRLAAIRFMEVNDYLPSGIKVLSGGDIARLEPECVREFERVPYIDQTKAAALKAESDEALYRYILVKQCTELVIILPGMFSRVTDYAELLLPDRLFSKDCIVYDLTHSDIPESDFREQVEIIGWLYQYYISEKKDEVFARPKGQKIKKEEIPAATQLFTPDWIVRYMVENSLGRLWLENHADNDLLNQWKYYILDAEQTPEVEAEIDKRHKLTRNIKPEDIRFIDPCMGSGHILVYAFDVLFQIYVSAGYAERDIPDLILKNNLFGLDIDERACQLSYFALMMKARAYNRRFLRRETADIPQPQVYATVGDADLEEYGSLLKVSQVGEKPVEPTDLIEMSDYESCLVAWNARSLLTQKYDVVVTNPPYMGASGMNGKLAEYVKNNYPDSKSDLFAAFIERCGEMLKPTGYQAMITQHAWMFLSSYEKLREKLLQRDIVNMARLGAKAFEEIGGEVVQTVAFVMNTRKTPGFLATYARLVDFDSQDKKEAEFLSGEHRHTAVADNFAKIPGSPVAYWVSEKMLRVFESGELLGEIAFPKTGMTTGDNNRFLRMWYEVAIGKFNQKWFPYCKGGGYRRWYGYNEYLVNWENDGFEIKNNIKDNGLKAASVRSENLYFKPLITWSAVTSGTFSCRNVDGGALFDSGGSSISANRNQLYLLALLNSKLTQAYLDISNATLNYQPGDIAAVPVIIGDIGRVEEITAANIALSRADWDAFETSWDFKRHPLIRGEHSIEAAFALWEREAAERFDTLKHNEEELNRIFINIYGLQDELTPEVEDKDMTVRRADLGREIRSLISYAVGCMFGRYSLDTDGLAYAGGAWDASKYASFIPDKDNVLPINDIDYFDDDIVVRFTQFVRVVFGEDWLENNLEYIADTLYPGANGSSRDKLRRYFMNDFYKDHVKIYQKKPIYWQFDSGKQGGFKALIYLHRYDKYTVGRVRTEYMHPQQRMYEDEIKRIAALADLPETNASNKASGQKRTEFLQKKIAECREYDAIIAHIALQNPELDLDDGVTANYAKFQGVEIALGDGRPPKKMDLLTKI